jgi:hypothetical protein
VITSSYLKRRKPSLRLRVGVSQPWLESSSEVYGAVTFVIVLTGNRTDLHKLIPLTADFCFRSDKDPAVGY